MTSPVGIHHHHYADDLLEDYVLGTLSAEETAWMQGHLKTCSRCQAEVEPLLGAMQALLFSAPAPDLTMSDDLWDRIERSILESPSGTVSPEPVIPHPTLYNTRFMPLARIAPRAWLAVAALMLISLITGAMLDQAEPQIGEDKVGIERIVAEFTDPNVDATGELLYLPEEKVFLLNVSGMPVLPPGYVYQAWLIEGNVTTSVGLLDAETRVFAVAGDRDKLQMFCVTVEPGPLGTEAPTTDPILIVPLERADSAL